jgi:excinuclease ABC subunit A
LFRDRNELGDKTGNSMATEILQPQPVTRQMELRGVRVHNLKNLDLNIPLGCLVVISGVSGSGKSSLAFDTLFAEGQRRYVESFSIAARQHLERIDRPDADRIAHVPPAIAIRSDRDRRHRHDSRSTVATVADLLDGLRLLFARIGKIVCPKCHTEVRAHSAADVVRTVIGLPAGTRCQLGFAVSGRSEFDDPVALWLARGFSRAIWGGASRDLNSKPVWPTSDEAWLIVDRIVAGKTSAERISESAEVALREGAGRCWLLVDANDTAMEQPCRIDGRDWSEVRFNRHLVCNSCNREFLPVEPRLFSHLASGACQSCRGTGRSLKNDSATSICTACEGTRFRDEARAVHIANRSIADICAQTPPLVKAFIRELNDSLTADEKSLTELIRADIEQRFSAVCDLGLGYLTLDRAAETLSGGEVRRLMLAAVIGSKITGMLVVVDEPSAGLADNELPLVIDALRKLQGLRNSVIAVEHSPTVVASADYVIELGPGAGPAGGHIVFEGPPEPIRASPISKDSSGTEKPTKAKSIPFIRLAKVQHRNLQNFAVEFLLGKLNVVSGPSGSGKTSLVTEVLFPTLCKKLGLPVAIEASHAGTCELSGGEGLVDAVLIDQSPLTKSTRSNPATWLEVFDEIRKTFAETMDARQRGFTAQHFSFNSSSGGRCRSCQGTGLLKQDMQFLPDVTLTCPECSGTRYRREILEVKYRGRSIADVLAMSVSEAAVFFRSQPHVQYRFQLLKQIGLDYLVLGQPSETLSGGEAQRLKLAARLALPNRGPNLIVCDEPTIGLHPTDVGRLIGCFQELIANGHTLVLADNSPELLLAADRAVYLSVSFPASSCPQ